MGMMQEFKEFAVKGNVIDLAVGVIIGGAFGKIVGSLVDDVIMPVVGSVFGKLDFSNLFITLGAAPEGTARTLAAMKEAGVPPGLRQLHFCRHQFPDPGLRDLPDGQADQPPQAPGARCPTGATHDTGRRSPAAGNPGQLAQMKG